MKRLSIVLAIALVAPLSLNAATLEEGSPLKEFMGHVMQRNAIQLWAWTAWESDEKGERYDQPASDEDWEDAESDAQTLVQLAASLKRAPYTLPDPRWAPHADALEAAARQSAQAAEAKDFDALLKAGDRINEQCIACHMTFVPELEAGPPALAPSE